jgi:hypothetical protein
VISERVESFTVEGGLLTDVGRTITTRVFSAGSSIARRMFACHPGWGIMSGIAIPGRAEATYMVTSRRRTAGSG